MKLYLILTLVLLAGCTQRMLSQDTTGLDEAKMSEIIELNDKETFELEAKKVKKTIDGNELLMYGYNGQLPGPIIKAKQGSEITVNFKNSLEMPTTVHWHGVRVENKYDGTPDVTQKEVKPGETFEYKLRFPDNGIYWYHPHLREDIQQELGLYGAILVHSEESFNFDKEEVLFLDDIRLVKGKPEQFSLDESHYTLMGRFGNLMLANGETDYATEIEAGKTLRLYIVNSANTRTFNFSIENTKLKVIGGDSGFYEQEFLSDSIVISPSERAIVEVVFETPGEYKIYHKNPEKTYELGSVLVKEGTSKELSLETHETVKKDIERLKKHLDKQPDFEIELTIELQMNHQMEHGIMENSEGIEWEDSMAVMNAMSTNKNTRWILRDRKTGKENMDIEYSVKTGDIKKIRLINTKESVHPMQHPLHLHGQRFLVVSVDGVQNNNFVWKDTVLVPAGKTVDILVEFTNPGRWMIHCHISEHLEAGMMSVFEVEE